MRGNFFYKKIGERIYLERKRKSISQEKLSFLSDIDRTYLSRIENGKVNPSVKVIRKISKGLRIKVNKIVKDV
ncbi:MAG: helix-turn-helix transcriptional regulator [bacterium]